MNLTGLRPCFIVYWRRNRAFWLCWMLVLVPLMPLTVVKYHDLTPPGSDPRTMMEMLAANPTMRAILGPPYDLMTPGGFTMWRVGTFTAACLALMAGLGIIRTTRAEEESGRSELLRAAPMSRNTPLTAALALESAVCLVTGLLISVGMMTAGTPAAGSLASGIVIALTGSMFAAVAAAVAQLTDSARTARVWTLGFGLGGLYLMRALIDATGDRAAVEPLRWLIPLEWPALVRPYAHERWVVLILPILLNLGFGLLAFVLEHRRDHGSGLRVTPPGRPRGKPSLTGALSLAWRLHRGGVIGWLISIGVSAGIIGSLADTLGEMTQSNPAIEKMMHAMGGAGAIHQAFFSAMLSILATVSAIAAVSAVGALRHEETSGRAELLLSTPTTRHRMAASHLVYALALPTVLLLLAGAVVSARYALAHDHGIALRTIQGAAALTPGLWFFSGVGMALLGWVPRLLPLAWMLLGWTLLTTWIGPLLNVPEWLLMLQPWVHLPHPTTGPMNWAPWLLEAALGLGLVALGLAGYARRDIPR